LEVLRLQNTKEDIVYENKWQLEYDEDELATMPIIVEATLLDTLFSIVDFSI